MAGLFGGHGLRRPGDAARTMVPLPGPPLPRLARPSGGARDHRPAPELPVGDIHKARADLRIAIAAVREEEQRLSALTQARERAMNEHDAALDVLRRAQNALEEVKRADPTRLAFDYANGKPAPAVAPVQEAHAEVDRAQAEVTRLEQIRAALEGEVKASEGRLTFPRMRRDQAKAAVVLACPQYAEYYSELREDWKRLRTRRAVLGEIERSAHVSAPHGGHWQAEEPLEERSGYPLDWDVVEAWQKALDALTDDADAPLPEL